MKIKSIGGRQHPNTGSCNGYRVEEEEDIKNSRTFGVAIETEARLILKQHQI